MASRIAVVTGSNQGIGYHIALQIACSGRYSDVILACRRKDAGTQAAAKMKQVGAKCNIECMQLDIGKEASINAFTHLFRSTYGALHCLVNNAGMAFKGADPTPFNEQAEPTINVN